MNNTMRKLTPEDVRQIRRLCAEGHRRSEVAKMFGVHRQTVWDVLHGKTWARAA